MNNYKIVYSLEENKLFGMLTAKIKWHFSLAKTSFLKQTNLKMNIIALNEIACLLKRD